MLPSSKRQTATTPVAGIVRHRATSLESTLVRNYPHCLVLSAHVEMEPVIFRGFQQQWDFLKEVDICFEP